MESDALAFLTDAACLNHEMGSAHPEAPERLRAISQHLKNTGMLDQLTLPNLIAADEQVIDRLWSATHHPDMLNRLESLSPREGYADIDPDTRMNPHSLGAARHSTSLLIRAADGIAAREFRSAFCAIRPPGHHAEYGAAMGFCLINQAAVVVNYLRQAHGARSFAILDFDVHHGNGTFDIFRGDDSVLVCSSYQHPFYPGRHVDTTASNLVHSRLPAGSRCDALLPLIDRDWLPALQHQRPEWVIFSAGFDAHRDDPLGGLNWSTDDYYRLSRHLLDIVEPYCQGRVISLLEGGYNLTALANSVEAHLLALRHL